MQEPELFRRIHDELKRTIRLEQLRRDHPADRIYANLFEVDISGTYAIRVAGSEESLTRLAEKYIARGYRVRSGDPMATIRAVLRWDAPGDDLDGWYWGDQDEDIPLTRLIEQAVQAGLIRDGDDRPLRRLCLDALRELDDEEAFGQGLERERLLIGITCCEISFGEPEDIDVLAALNPAPTIARLRQELALADSTSLISPWDGGKTRV